jgi:hypothetical protein
MKGRQTLKRLDGIYNPNIYRITRRTIHIDELGVMPPVHILKPINHTLITIQGERTPIKRLVVASVALFAIMVVTYAALFVWLKELPW